MGFGRGNLRFWVVSVALGAAFSVALVVSAGADVGWRTDGTGRYPGARPPVQWAPDKNVVWATPLPGGGNSLPILVGGKVFLTTEPATLLCLDAASGQILWQRGNTYEDTAPDQAATIRQEQQRADQARGELGKLDNDIKKLKTALQDKPNDPDLKAQLADKQKAAGDWAKVLDQYRKQWYALPETHPFNGYASPTPTSDGEHVYAVFGNGMVVCYDLEGNKVWGKLLEKPPSGWGHSASPLLVGDKLIVHILNVSALNKLTGEPLWQVRRPEGWGSEQLARVGDTDIIVTPRGDFLRVSDGKLLAQGVAALEYCSPVVAGGVVYFIENGGKAIKLPEAMAGDALNLQVLWTTMPKKERYYGSPVVDGAYIYACNQASVFSIIDATTGKVVWDENLGLGGTVFGSVSVADGLVYVSGENGKTMVSKVGPEFKAVATNKIEPFRSSLVFAGDRLYIHGSQKLYCFGGGQ